MQAAFKRGLAEAIDALGVSAADTAALVRTPTQRDEAG
jgi:hypothetical protein